MQHEVLQQNMLPWEGAQTMLNNIYLKYAINNN